MTVLTAPAVVIRPLRPSDRERYVRAVEGLSAETWRLRFMSVRRRLTGREIDYLLDVGRDGREALAAVDPVSGAIMGVARYAPVSGDRHRVEAAIVVGDSWQGHGVGHQLFEALLTSAAAAGVCEITASTVAGNRTIAGMLRRRGFGVVGMEAGVAEWSRLLIPHQRCGPPDPAPSLRPPPR